jgi:hypothetical protein
MQKANGHADAGGAQVASYASMQPSLQAVLVSQDVETRAAGESIINA